MHVYRTVLSRGEEEARFREAVKRFLDLNALDAIGDPVGAPASDEDRRVEISVLFWSSEALAQFDRFWRDCSRKEDVASELGAVFASLKLNPAGEDDV